MPGWIAAAASFVKKPDPSLSLVDKVFQQARSGYVVMFVANVVHLAHGGNEAPYVDPDDMPAELRDDNQRRTACFEALKLSRQDCRDFALGMTWKASAQAFLDVVQTSQTVRRGPKSFSCAHVRRSRKKAWPTGKIDQDFWRHEQPRGDGARD